MGQVMEVARVAGWEVILAAEIEAAQRLPFVWGAHDCATWTFDLVALLRGTASAADAWRGRYRTALGAERVMRRLGWPTMEAGGRALLGAPLDTPLLARRGDVVLCDGAFGICTGARAALLAPDGLTMRPLRDCALAWRV